ncbi:hypothetical protein KRP69_01760 [Mammaliicoccus sciuri]|uniref:hypothetical protein n=1 Tax=Mammaliicoccus sciuri TaxID=1296 RepID=UPI001D0D1EF6|nr:hypothetical protein [Mammaliicoccus sciuri]MCC2087931.1 hypothetical protein [Mammaliicoccus sciuri]
MTVQIELFNSPVNTLKDMQEIENTINKFATENKVIDIKTSFHQAGKALIMYAIVVYEMNDHVESGWKGIFNQIATVDNEYEDVLKAFLKLDRLDVSEKTIDKLVHVYSHDSIITELAKINNIEVETEAIE